MCVCVLCDKDGASASNEEWAFFLKSVAETKTSKAQGREKVEAEWRICDIRWMWQSFFLFCLFFGRKGDGGKGIFFKIIKTWTI